MKRFNLGLLFLVFTAVGCSLISRNDLLRIFTDRPDTCYDDVGNLSPRFYHPTRKLLKFMSVRCSICLSFTKNLNDTFTKHRLSHVTEDFTDEFSCSSRYILYGLREVGSMTYIGPPMKHGVLIRTALDGKWDNVFMEFCEYFKVFYNPQELYKKWLDEDFNLFKYLCLDGGVLMQCRNMIDPETLPKCELKNYVCLYRSLRLLPFFTENDLQYNNTDDSCE